MLERPFATTRLTLFASLIFAAWLGVLLAWLGVLFGGYTRAPADLRVFAAASLKDAIDYANMQ